MKVTQFSFSIELHGLFLTSVNPKIDHILIHVSFERPQLLSRAVFLGIFGEGGGGDAPYPKPLHYFSVPVVQRVDNVIQRIDRYPVDKMYSN